MSNPTFDEAHDNHDFKRAAKMSEEWELFKGASKLCVNCKNSRFTGDLYHYGCSLFAVQSPVTGEVTLRLCSILREEGNACGPQGVFWEAQDA